MRNPSERRCEILREISGSAVEVGLEDGHHPPPGHRLPSCLEQGPELGRVMGVVIYDGHPATISAHLEPPRHSGKVGARRSQNVELETELETDRDRGEGVEGIEGSGHPQQHIAEPAVLPKDRKLGATGLAGFDLEPHFGLFRESVAHDLSPQIITETPCSRVVSANNDRAKDRSTVGEGGEGQPQFLLAPIAVEMLGLEVGNHSQMRRQLEEGSIVLIGLAYQERRITDPGVGTEEVRSTTDDDRRVGAGRRQEVTDDGSGRGFAMGAGNCNSSLEPHQLGEHFRPPHNRQPPLRRRHQLRIFFRHSGGDDQRIDTLEVTRLVTVVDLRTEFGQSPRPLIVREITAAHRQALGKQHLGDAAHADPTDTHQVEMRANAHTPPPIDSTRSAMRAAAFGRATSRAERPMSRSESWSRRSFPRSIDTLRGIASCSVKTSAPPALSRLRALNS